MQIRKTLLWQLKLQIIRLHWNIFAFENLFFYIGHLFFLINFKTCIKCIFSKLSGREISKSPVVLVFKKIYSGPYMAWFVTCHNKLHEMVYLFVEFFQNSTGP